jgi:CheY-like chemotaxis protein
MPTARRILVVEGKPDHGAALSQLLELWGHTVTIATSGRAAILRTLRTPFEVIVIDLALADMDGCTVVRAIRSDPDGDVPLIIAYSGAAHREAGALTAGCDVFVLKPELEELEWLVERTQHEARQYTKDAGPASVRRR